MKKIVGCLLVSGCVQPEPVGLTLQSVLPGAVQGVALDGTQARVGMDNQLCDIDVQTAEVLGDTDVVAQPEYVLDARDGVIVGAVRDQLFIVDSNGTRAFEGPVVDARVARDGQIVAVLGDSEGCRVAFGETAFSVEPLDCSEDLGMAVESEGVAWFADGKHLVRVEQNGQAKAWEASFDRLAWDERSGLLIAGLQGGETVFAVRSDGTMHGQVPIDGTLRGLAAVGVSGATAVMVDEGGPAALILVDGALETVVEHPLPAVAQMEIGPDGTTMALQTADATIFYGVESDPGWLSVGDGVRSGSGGETAIAVGAASAVTVAGVVLVAATLVD